MAGIPPSDDDGPAVPVHREPPWADAGTDAGAAPSGRHTDREPDEVGDWPPPFPGGQEGTGPPPYPGAPPPPYPGGPPGYPGGPGRGPWGPPPVAPFADWAPRVGAYLIDSLLLWVVALVVGRVVHPGTALVIELHTTNAQGQPVVDHFSGLALIVDAVVGLLYGTLLCGSRAGQTLGMRLVRIKVVDQRSGGPVGYGRALGRVLLQWVALWLAFIPWVIDMLFPLWDARRQTLHDKIVGSVVVRA